MAINPNEIDIKNIIELIQSSSIKDNDLLVVGQGIYARKSTVLDLYNKFGVPSILTSLNSLQFQINQLNNTVGNSVLYSPQVKTPQQKSDARNNLDVYSKTETQTVVNSAIINLGNVVNSVNGVNVDNTDPKNPIVATFRPLLDYQNDMLLKADIDGNLTIGGIWWQDQVLSDRFANYKQVYTALTNNTIEWGNIELDKHVFLVDDINGIKVKVGGTEGTVWNSLNLTNVSQLNNDAGYLQSNDLDGFIYDATYVSSTAVLTLFRQNAPNVVIDFPTEELIKDIEIVNIAGVDYLRLWFEDGTYKDVPLNTLLVGVVKSVNGLTPNSQGEIILNITDIPNLSSELANKLDIRMTGLVSNLTQPEKDAIHTKLGIINNVIQTLGLSSNTLSLSGGGGSVSLGIINIGGLQTALDNKVNIDGSSTMTSFLKFNNNWSSGGDSSITNLYRFYYNGVSKVAIGTDGDIETESFGRSSLWNAKYDFPSGGNSGQYINGLGQLATLPTQITYTGSNGVVLVGNDFQLTTSVLSSIGLANSAVQPSTLSNYVRIDGASTMTSFLKFNNGWSSGGDANVTGLYRFYYNNDERISFGTDGDIYTPYGNASDWNNKQDKLTAGTNVSIVNDVISATDTTYSSSNGIQQTGTNFTPVYGTTANTVAQGNDSRINNGQTAFDWGNFLDYGLHKYVNLGNIGANGLNSTLNATGFYFAQGVDTSIVGSSTVKLLQFGNSDESGQVGQLLISHGLGNSAAAQRIAYRSTQTATWVELYTTGNLPTIPTPNNGSFTVQGDGNDIVGSGSTSADASANTYATLSLSTVVKNRIQQGAEAREITNIFFGDLLLRFKYYELPAGGAVDVSETLVSQISAKNNAVTIDIQDHFLNGAELRVVGNPNNTRVDYTINAVDFAGNNLPTFYLEANFRKFVWDDSIDKWRETI